MTGSGLQLQPVQPLHLLETAKHINLEQSNQEQNKTTQTNKTVKPCYAQVKNFLETEEHI